MTTLPILDRSAVADFVLGDLAAGRRFTLDGPVVESIWNGYGIVRPGFRSAHVDDQITQDLLLDADRSSTPGILVHTLQERLDKLFPGSDAKAAFAGFGVAKLTLEQMVFALLPLSEDWCDLCYNKGQSHLLVDEPSENLLHRIHVNRPAFLA